MNEKQIYYLMHSLINNKDLNSITDIKKFIDFAKGIDINSIFYIDNGEYYSPLEIFLVELNRCGYPIGYTVDILKDILKQFYNYKELNILSDAAVLELFAIVTTGGDPSD